MILKIIIHRGTNQIGGCITEIRTDNTRIFIDLGSELPDDSANFVPESISINGLTNGVVNCDAVLFTHYHSDHIGMLTKILPGIPFYMGAAAKDIYCIFQDRLSTGLSQFAGKANTFKAGRKFSINDIMITPISVDHSAYDAYMFLIEADGKKVLHTGDFRMHGFRGKGVEKALVKYVGRVNVLITEGTLLSRSDSKVISEHELQTIATKILNEFKYTFVICSSTNIDRLGAFHEATPDGKYFVCDNYQKVIFDVVNKHGGHYSSLYRFNKALIYGRNLRLEDHGFCMPVRSGKFFSQIMQYYKDNYNDETVVVYSMWDGYLRQPNNKFDELLNGFKNIRHLHTSGHATLEAIEAICKIVVPKQAIIPIHSEAPQILLNSELKEKVILLNDGKELDVL